MRPTRLILPQRTFPSVGSRCVTLLALLLLLPLWHCSPSQVCKGGISNLTLDAKDSLCADDCDCNNQLYEGLCTKGTCITRKREACATPGAQRPCTLIPGPHTGACTAGTQTCQPTVLKEALWGDCWVALEPEQDALCQDGKDNDCDGLIDRADEGCRESCSPGAQEKCYTGTSDTEGVGSCRSGVRTCGASRRWSTCKQEVTPKPETCNLEDDDCDGQIDEDVPNCQTCIPGQEQSCYTGKSGCSEQGGKYTCAGPCKAGTQACTKDGRWGRCQGQLLAKAEDCNSVDDDCNGKVDDGRTGPLEKLCYPANTGCTKKTDETYSCTTPCRPGTQLCVDGKWTDRCEGTVVPQPEVCDNQDNDCDGKVDEEVIGPPCENQVGACAGSKKTSARCKDGKWTPCADDDYKAHSADYSPTETCDGKDNNCNRERDENLIGCVVTILGTAGQGEKDGPAERAQLNLPYGLHIHKGKLYIADFSNNKIRIVEKVTNATCADKVNYTGYCVSTLSTDTPLPTPVDLLTDTNNNLYISSQTGRLYRTELTSGKVLATPVVSDQLKFRDGPAPLARFHLPQGLATDAFGALYIADFGNHRIRKLHQVKNYPCSTTYNNYSGLCVSTIAGDGTAGFKTGPALQAQLNEPIGLALSPQGNLLYISLPLLHHIAVLDLQQGTISTFAGSGFPGLRSGSLSQAQFNRPEGLAIDPTNGTLYVADTFNHSIRQINPSGNLVVTIVGDGTIGSADGFATKARLNEPTGLAFDAATGTLYISEQKSHRIRRVKVR